MNVFTLINELILPGKQNRFKKLHEKLGTSDMGLVFTLLAIHEGYSTRQEIMDLREQRCCKKYLQYCETAQWIIAKLEPSAHDARARVKVYEMTDTGQQQAQAWLDVINPLMAALNQ